MPYQYQPYQSPLTASIGELLAHRGDPAAQAAMMTAQARARAAEMNGRAYGNLAQGIGNTIQGVTQQIEQDRREAPRRELQGMQIDAAKQSAQDDMLLRQALSMEKDGDLTAGVQFLQKQGPMGVAALQKLNAFVEQKQAQHNEEAAQLGFNVWNSGNTPDAARAVAEEAVRAKKLTPEQGQQFQAMFVEDPDMTKRLMGNSDKFRQYLKEEKVEPPKTREIKTRNADGSESIQIVEDKPGFQATSAAVPEKPQAPTPTSLALEAAGGDPIKALQLLRAQNASQAQPDYEWVTRNGNPTQIRKGSAVAGDVPYAPPRSTSETAQDRQREGRYASARGFLKRLNELREKINTKIGPEAGISGTYRRGMAKIGLDPDVAEYEKVRAAGGRALAVAIMGAQNLSDADANAWSNMLPGATIDKVTAERLTTQIDKMLETTGEDGKGGHAPEPPKTGVRILSITPVKKP